MSLVEFLMYSLCKQPCSFATPCRWALLRETLLLFINAFPIFWHSHCGCSLPCQWSADCPTERCAAGWQRAGMLSAHEQGAVQGEAELWKQGGKNKHSLQFGSLSLSSIHHKELYSLGSFCNYKRSLPSCQNYLDMFYTDGRQMKFKSLLRN